MRRPCWWSFGVFLLIGSCLHAQSIFDATKDRILTGTVAVPNGQLPGPPIVTLYDSLHRFIERKGTDDTGSYSFEGVGAGDLLLVINLAGYEEASIPVRVWRLA